MEKKKINLIEYLYVLVKWRRLIVTNFLIVSIVAVIFSLLLPKWYESTAVLMPPKAEFRGLNISSLISKLPFEGFGLGGASAETQAFVAILKSRTIMERIIHDFNLIDLYGKKDIEKTLKELEGNIDITIGDEGQLVVSILAQTPERAASMANTIITLMDSTYTQLNIEKARNDRVFIEERLKQNKRELKNAEETLKFFQQESGIIDIPDQTRAAISSAAELQSMIHVTEIELGVEQKHLTSDHIKILQHEALLEEYKRKLAELKYGRPTSSSDDARDGDIFIPFDLIPDIWLDYVRLLREVEVQNKIFDFLVPLYEQARIEEAKDIPNIQVLDYPAVPIYKKKPKRAILCIVAAFLSLIVSSVFVFVKEFLNESQKGQDDQAQKVNWIREQLTRDLQKLRRKRG